MAMVNQSTRGLTRTNGLVARASRWATHRGTRRLTRWVIVLAVGVGGGQLTIFDFLIFQNLFAAGDPAADLDGDGALTIFDFLAFQNAFDLGCP